MPGLLTHLIIAFVGFLVAYFAFYKSKSKWKYGLAFAIGSIITDAISFVISGIKLKTFRFHLIAENPLFWKISVMTHHFYIWIMLFVLLFVINIFLLKIRKINKETFKTWFIANLIFFIAVLFHLILDILIIENSYWI